MILVKKRRRFFAFITDLFVAVSLSGLLTGFLGLFQPLDNPKSLILKIFVGVFIGFLYLFISVFVWKTTLGRLLFSYQIVPQNSEDSKSLLIRQFLLYALLPVNMIIVLFGKSEIHLGDRFAQTKIIMNPNPKSGWLGFVGLVFVVFLSMKISKYGVGLGLVNSESYKVAKHYVDENYPEIKTSKIPTSFQIVNNEASYFIGDNKKIMKIYLKKINGKWTFIDASPINYLPALTQISFTNQEVEI